MRSRGKRVVCVSHYDIVSEVFDGYEGGVCYQISVIPGKYDFWTRCQMKNILLTCDFDGSADAANLP